MRYGIVQVPQSVPLALLRFEGNVFYVKSYIRTIETPKGVTAGYLGGIILLV